MVRGGGAGVDDRFGGHGVGTGDRVSRHAMKREAAVKGAARAAG